MSVLLQFPIPSPREAMVLNAQNIARGLTGDARILALYRALNASLTAYDNDDANPDDEFAGRCCEGWHAVREMICETRATGPSGILAKLEILDADIGAKSASYVQDEYPQSIREDLEAMGAAA